MLIMGDFSDAPTRPPQLWIDGMCHVSIWLRDGLDGEEQYAQASLAYVYH